MEESEIRKELEAARRAAASGEKNLSAREDIMCGDVLLAEHNLSENRNQWEIAGLARELMEQASVLEGYDHLLDRIDIQVEVSALKYSQLSSASSGEPSSEIRKSVIAARKIQEERYREYKHIHCNAQMTERMIHQYAEPNSESLDMLRMAMERLSLSARAYSRILKVARTIADLDGSEQVQLPHIAEAVGYRNLDRSDWSERGI